VRHPFRLGRDAGALRLRKAEGYFGSGQASIPGRLVLDGIDLLSGAFVRMDEYSLDAVAREVLGEGKAVAGDVRDRIAKSCITTNMICLRSRSTRAPTRGSHIRFCRS
jgi:DNA polymerase-2